MRNPIVPLLAFMTPRHYLVAAAAFYTLMIGGGAIPGNAQALSSVVYDKLLHFFAYAVLACLVWGTLGSGPARRAVLTLLVIALLGGADEGLQSLMPYRDASWADWQFDMYAAMASVAFLIVTHWLAPAVLRAPARQPRAGMADGRRRRKPTH